MTRTGMLRICRTLPGRKALGRLPHSPDSDEIGQRNGATNELGREVRICWTLSARMATYTLRALSRRGYLEPAGLDVQRLRSWVRRSRTIATPGGHFLRNLQTEVL